MKTSFLSRRERGFTFLEVMIALSLGMIAIMAVAKGIQSITTRSNVSVAVTDIQYILQASVSWRASQTSYSGISMSVLENQGLLPSAIGSGSGTNPWGGNYTVTANASNGNLLDIALSNVASDAGAQAVTLLQKTSYNANSASYSGGTLSVTY